jgi:VWFA-related protein
MIARKKLIMHSAKLLIMTPMLLVACLSSALGNPPQSESTPGGVNQQGVPQSPIQVNVELVSTPVVVQNENGEMIYGLGPQDFRIFDNGVQQTLEGFEAEGAPLTTAFVIETSSRVEALLPAIQRTGLLITESYIGETGEAALIGYSDQVAQLLDITNDHGAFEKTVTNLHSNRGGAHLYDALSQTVEMLRKIVPSRRRVIVTLAEDIDTGSKKALDAIVHEAQIEGITIYAIGLSTFHAGWHGPQKQAAAPAATPSGIFALPPIPGSVYTPTIDQLRNGNMDVGALGGHVLAFALPPMGDAAAATGGSYQSTFSGDSIETAIDQVAGELSAQYTLSYRPDTAQTKGSFHKIKVVVTNKGKLKVRSKPGYYVRSRQ